MINNNNNNNNDETVVNIISQQLFSSSPSLPFQSYLNNNNSSNSNINNNINRRQATNITNRDLKHFTTLNSIFYQNSTTANNNNSNHGVLNTNQSSSGELFTDWNERTHSDTLHFNLNLGSNPDNNNINGISSNNNNSLICESGDPYIQLSIGELPTNFTNIFPDALNQVRSSVIPHMDIRSCNNVQFVNSDVLTSNNNNNFTPLLGIKNSGQLTKKEPYYLKRQTDMSFHIPDQNLGIANDNQQQQHKIVYNNNQQQQHYTDLIRMGHQEQQQQKLQHNAPKDLVDLHVTSQQQQQYQHQHQQLLQHPRQQQQLAKHQDNKLNENEFFSAFFDANLNRFIIDDGTNHLQFMDPSIANISRQNQASMSSLPTATTSHHHITKQHVPSSQQQQQQQIQQQQQPKSILLQTALNDNLLNNNNNINTHLQQQQQQQQQQQILPFQKQQPKQPRATQQHLIKQPSLYRDAQEQKISDYAFKCLTDYDFCVLDHFQGTQKSLNLLNEVQKIINSQRFEDGRLVAVDQDSLAVRGDKIFWIGDLNATPCIKQLIGMMDRIIFKFNDKLPNVFIRSHSQPMLACYPGSGAGYMRHVDNSNQDGRLITCLYYLNKDWDAQANGGMLRLHPSIKHEKVDVDPILDRMLLFWSDCRNPHEVLPSYKNRYAITVWYFDTEERENAKLKLQDSGKDQKYVASNFLDQTH